MAVGHGELPTMHPVTGFRLGVASAGIKTPGRADLVVMALGDSAVTAGVFTKNAFCAAPVTVAKQHIAAASPNYFVVNTGNANAGTGQQGIDDSRAVCAELSVLTKSSSEKIIPFSTGVIGESLPTDKIINALPLAIENLSENAWALAAEGIMTTDTRPKGASLQIEYDGELITVTGIAKGAGMIKPNMATMLAYVATDATVEPPVLNEIIQSAVDSSFNRITVDGDTSTNDACMLVATGVRSSHCIDSNKHPLYSPLLDAVSTVFIELAQGLVRDAEGASKFVAVEVLGGCSEQECLQVAYTVAESPLVKTALFASDPNWGRLLAAIGRAGVKDLNVDAVSVHINGVLIAEHGCRAKTYTEEQGNVAMAAEEITISINLSRGKEDVTVWTSDLSYDYVRINAEYRT